MCGLDEDSRNSDGWGSHYRFAASHLATTIQAHGSFVSRRDAEAQSFLTGGKPPDPSDPLRRSRR